MTVEKTFSAMGAVQAVSLLLYGIVIAVSIKGGQCLSDVRVVVEPAMVARGGSALVLCQYQLEEETGDTPYVVVFYSGPHEIFRCVADNRCRVLPLGGMVIDISQSNATQMQLMGLQPEVSGNFTCEVIFSTFGHQLSKKKGTAQLQVVVPPKGDLSLSVEDEGRYRPGDRLKAECEVPPSDLQLDMFYLLNDFPVNASLCHRHQKSNRLSLNMVLQLSNFTPRGELSLKCVAQLPGIYRGVAERDIGFAPQPLSPQVKSGGVRHRLHDDLALQTLSTMLVMVLRMVTMS